MAMNDMDSSWPDSQIDPPIKPLTRDEAKALLDRHPKVSLWSLLMAQALLGLVVAGVWWLLSGNQMHAVSAAYGALVVLVPNVIMVRAVFGGRSGRSVGGLVAWEFVKVVVAGLMLAAAPLLIVPLHWVAMLVTMVLCMKVMVVMLLLRQHRPQKN